jgi:hypothetical protein
MPDNYQQDDNLNNSNISNNIPPQQPLGRGQKIAAGVLAVFAVAVIGMWFVQFKKSIINPLRPSTGTQNTVSSQNENSDEALKNKDTDADGLSDWDELNLYKTSPYLEDSDSDGFLDKEEILNGKDPNCPAGRDCFNTGGVNTDNSANQGSAGANNASNELLNQLSQLNIQSQGQGSIGQSNDEAAIQNILGGGGDAAALRQMLLSAGMDKAMLDKISDEDLMKSYNETLNSNKQ